jgi:hypothetical protein
VTRRRGLQAICAGDCNRLSKSRDKHVRVRPLQFREKDLSDCHRGRVANVLQFYSAGRVGGHFVCAANFWRMRVIG